MQCITVQYHAMQFTSNAMKQIKMKYNLKEEQMNVKRRMAGCKFLFSVYNLHIFGFFLNIHW